MTREKAIKRLTAVLTHPFVVLGFDISMPFVVMVSAPALLAIDTEEVDGKTETQIWSLLRERFQHSSNEIIDLISKKELEAFELQADMETPMTEQEIRGMIWRLGRTKDYDGKRSDFYFADVYIGNFDPSEVTELHNNLIDGVLKHFKQEGVQVVHA